jgi:two-component system sensor histidine kinase CpxA
MAFALRWPLSQKILGLALLNLALIAVVLVVFVQRQFGLSIESLVLGPARDRILSLSNAIARDLDSTPYTSRVELLNDYSRRYGVDVFLVDPDGQSLTGRAFSLPPAVLERVRGRPRESRPAPEDPLDLGPEGRDRPKLPPPRADAFGRPPPRSPSGAAFLVMTRDPLLWWVGVRIPTNGPRGERGFPAVLLLRTNSILNDKLFFDWRSLLWLGLALTAVGLLCWWPFLHGVARSIRLMDSATEEIAQGHFEHHVTLQRHDELGHLGGQINRMAVRLEGFVRHQKRFLGDISHELSAPIARIQFALGILEQKLDQPRQMHLDVLRDEIQEMSQLVNELLMFSKAGVVPGTTPLACVDLGHVVQKALGHQVIGDGTIQVDIAPQLCVMGHEPYLSRAISNLLRNALRYAGKDGPIVVSAWRERDRVVLSVADSGPGLPEGTHDDIFSPFYRPETVRNRDTGGAGLGLAIVKSCVEACRGTVMCRNRQPVGLELIISLMASNTNTLDVDSYP